MTLQIKFAFIYRAEYGCLEASFSQTDECLPGVLKLSMHKYCIKSLQVTLSSDGHVHHLPFQVTFAIVLLTLVVVMIQTPMSGVILLPVIVLYYFVQVC